MAVSSMSGIICTSGINLGAVLVALYIPKFQLTACLYCCDYIVLSAVISLVRETES